MTLADPLAGPQVPDEPGSPGLLSDLRSLTCSWMTALSSFAVCSFSVESMLISFLILFQNRADIPDRCMGMIIAVHDDNGTDGAAAQAGHGLQGELLVPGGLAGFDLQPSLKFIEDPRASPDVARGAPGAHAA